MNNELDDLFVLFFKNLLTEFHDLIFEDIMLILLVVIVNLIILHQHESDGQIEDKECTYPHNDQKVDADKRRGVDLLKKVHDHVPSLQGRTNEDCQQGVPDMVKVSVSIHKFFERGIHVQIWIIERVWLAALIKLLKS